MICLLVMFGTFESLGILVYKRDVDIRMVEDFFSGIIVLSGNLEAVLDAAGSSPDKAVKLTVFFSDWKCFKEMNEADAEFFANDPPARSTVQGERWPEGHLVAIDAIALVKQVKPKGVAMTCVETGMRII